RLPAGSWVGKIGEVVNFSSSVRLSRPYQRAALVPGVSKTPQRGRVRIPPSGLYYPHSRRSAGITISLSRGPAHFDLFHFATLKKGPSPHFGGVRRCFEPRHRSSPSLCGRRSPDATVLDARPMLPPQWSAGSMPSPGRPYRSALEVVGRGFPEPL